MSGPAGTGKSRACLEKVHIMCLLNPGMRALVVRKTLASLGSSTLVTWRKTVAAESLVAGHVVYYGGSAVEPAQYRYTNKSVVIVGGMDKASKIMSTEYDVIFVDEATELTEEDWEALTTRLRNGVTSFQQLVGACNPDSQYHWLKQRCDRGKTVMLPSTHTENPTLFHDDGVATEQGQVYLNVLASLTGVRRLRLEQGLWVAAEGIIYDEWDESVHLIDRFTVPQSWTRWWAIDFGYTNPFVWQDWAEDPDGRLYLVQEIYHTKRLVERHAEDILDIVAPKDDSDKRVWREPKPRAIICDHDAEGRATLEKHIGMGTTAAHKKVKEGIQYVQSRLQRQEDARPRIFVMKGSLVERDPDLEAAKKPCSTYEELPGYVWKAGDKEEPVKENDHGCDALRYVVAERDVRDRPTMRWLRG